MKSPKQTVPQKIIAHDDVTPETRSWARAHLAWLVLALCAALLFGVATCLALQHTLMGWEHTVFHKINGWQAPQWVSSQLARPLSDAVWGMIVLVALALLIPKVTARAWRYAVAGSGAFVVGFVVEHLVGRARPAETLHDATLRASQTGPGFPSDHVAVVTALCLTLWPFVSWPWRILLGLLIVGVAWSRVFLGVHAPLDVVGGFAVGLGVVAFIRLLPHKLLVKLHLD